MGTNTTLLQMSLMEPLFPLTQINPFMIIIAFNCAEYMYMFPFSQISASLIIHR